jgi:hypothetical protein
MVFADVLELLLWTHPEGKGGRMRYALVFLISCVMALLFVEMFGIW